MNVKFARRPGAAAVLVDRDGEATLEHGVELRSSTGEVVARVLNNPLAEPKVWIEVYGDAAPLELGEGLEELERAG